MKKKKIAILISGNNNNLVNKDKIKNGYNFKNVIQIFRKQFEVNYDVDYYCIFSEEFDKSIFDNKLKNYKIVSDKELNTNNVKHSNQFYRRKYLLDIIDKNENYHFYMFLRNDRLLIPNGYGLWDRTVKYEESAGWKKITDLNKTDYEIPFIFNNHIDFSYMYLISYGYKIDINKSICVWDGFCLGNFEKISIFLNFNIKNNKKYKWNIKRMPEIYLKRNLDKLNIKLKSIDDINEIPINDNHLQMMANCGYN